jgi:hypothetical protein
MVILSLKRRIRNQNKTITGLRRQITKLKNQIENLKQYTQDTQTHNVIEYEAAKGISLCDLVLGELCENNNIVCKRSRRWSDLLMSLAFVLYASSAKAYRFVKMLMPLPSVSQLYQRLGPKLRFLKEGLTDITKIESICEQWRRQQAISPDETIHVILGCDAASFKAEEINGQQCASCFAFLVMPLNPQFSTCVCHLCPWESGAMGEVAGLAMCKRVIEELEKCHVNVVSVATDGDRSYLIYQQNIFKHYESRLNRSLEELSDLAVASCSQRPWWLADPLHALKCQRCRLKNFLFIKTTELFTAASLNLKLNLKHSLTNLEGASKMNDIFAIQLFSLDNLITLIDSDESEINFSEIEYLTPFVLWYAVVAISNLSRAVRLDLLQIVFRVFARWHIILSNLAVKRLKIDVTNPEGVKTQKSVAFAVEGMDLIRYMNSVIFLYTVIKYLDDIALNRIGTHPVENYFGTIRLASNYDHSWDRFVSAAAKGILSSDILAANGLKTQSRRDFSVGGVKVFCQGRDQDKLDIQDLLEHGTNFLNILDGNPVENRPLVICLWVEDLMKLSSWKTERHAMELYNPGPVASDTALSRIIAFKPDPVAFKWTKRKIAKAVSFIDSGEMDYAGIANTIGCTAEDVRIFLECQTRLNVSNSDAELESE